MRYFMFVDESGDASVQSIDTSFNTFILCGVLISEASYSIFDIACKELKMKYFETDEVIFHLSKMRAKKGVFKIFQAPAVLANFLVDFHELLTNTDFKIISVLINKPAYIIKYPQRNSVYQEALKFMCERSVFCLRKEDIVKKFFIFMEQRDSQDIFIKKYYTANISNGTPFMSRMEMRVCEPFLNFRKKKANINGLQLADICAYPIGRKHLSPDTINPLYDIVHSKFYKSNSGEHIGYGLKIYPPPP